MKKTYRELKTELQAILNWFEQDDLDVEQAISKHAEAEKIIAELTAYLHGIETTIKKSKKSK